MNLVTVLIATLVVAVPVWAEAGRLAGRVVDSDLNEGVPEVTVRLGSGHAEAVTDSDGQFTIDDVPSGSVTLTADSIAIEPATFRVELTGTQGPLVLRVRYAAGGETIHIADSAPTRPQTASTHLVTDRDFTAAPRRTAEDALRLVPGLALAQHGSEGKGHQFFLRGFDAIHGADLELRVEGIPVNEWSNIHAQGYIDLGFVIPETIRAVEVTKGPYTLDQGAFAMAGSADYRLGIPEGDRGWRSAYTLGSTHRQRGVITYSPENGDGNDFVAVEGLFDAGFGERRKIQRATAIGRSQLHDSPRYGRLSLLASVVQAKFDLPGTLRADDEQAGRMDHFAAYDDDANGRSQRALASLAYRLQRGERTLDANAFIGVRKLGLLENFTGYLVDPVHGDRRGQHQSTLNTAISALAQVPITASTALRVGGGLRADMFRQSQDHVAMDGAPLERERDLRGTQGMAHAVAGAVWNPGDSVSFHAGARLDVTHVSARDQLADAADRGTLVAVSPRLSAQWRAASALRLFAAYGRGLRPPEARAYSKFSPERTGMAEELYDGGDAALTNSDAGEVGARWNPNGTIGIGVAGFATHIARESVFDHVSGVNLELRGTRRLGAEVDVEVTPADWLTLGADATYVDARFLGSGRPIPLAPSLMGGLRAAATHPNGFRGGLRVLGIAPRSLPHGAQGEPLISVDATAGYQWRQFRLELEVENLLNRKTRDAEYHYASHWGTTAYSELPTIHYVAGPPLSGRVTLSATF